MRIEIVKPFSTVITVRGDSVRIVGKKGDLLEVDDATGAALWRDVSGCLRAVAETGQVETHAGPEKVPAARTRQITRVRQPKTKR